jgi:hypothetical protein
MLLVFMSVTISAYNQSSTTPVTICNLNLFDYQKDERTRMYCVNQNEVQKISYWCKLGSLPLVEKPIASSSHPTFGSLGMDFVTSDSSTISCQMIIYYDFNPRRSHYNGEPHYNVENRICINDSCWIEKPKEHHCIRSCDYLKVEFSGYASTLFKPPFK